MLGSLGGSDGTQVSWFPHQALSSLSKATSYHVTCPSLRHGQYNVVNKTFEGKPGSFSPGGPSLA